MSVNLLLALATRPNSDQTLAKLSPLRAPTTTGPANAGLRDYRFSGSREDK